MSAFFENTSPLALVVIAIAFTWILALAGASVVFFFKKINLKILDIMLGFSAGVMISASLWSLLLPAYNMATDFGVEGWIPTVFGFLLGALFLFAIDRLLPHLHPGLAFDKAEGINSGLQRSILLVLAVTLHNIPVGLAVGVAFGALAHGGTASIGGAIALAVGIGIQNFPEGLAVAVSLRREGLSRIKSFFYALCSGFVEPLAGILGALAVIFIEPILPYALSFAAGAMIFLVVEELIPEAQNSGNTDLATIGSIFGFALMMFLDFIFAG
jgi:ZIP family zinc transporter